MNQKLTPEDLKDGLTVPEVKRKYQINRYYAQKMLIEAHAVPTKETRTQPTGQQAIVWKIR